MPDNDKPPVTVKPLGEYTKEAISIAPATTAEDSVLQIGAATPHTGSQALSLGFLEQVVTGMGVKYWRQSERALFTVSSSEESDLSVWLLADGDEHDILRITCTDKRKIAKAQWSCAMMAANAYHAKFRFGRVYLDIEEGQAEAVFLFDVQLLLEHGASEDLVKSFIISNLSCAHDWFDNVQREMGLYRNGKRRVNGKNSHTKGEVA